MKTLTQKIKDFWIPACAGMTGKGFTLIETLFAILIFSTALVALMSIAGRGISATSSARQQITAHYLAQEGLEVVRNMRDANYFRNAPWGTGFAVECIETSKCDVDYDPMPSAPPVLKESADTFLETDEEGFFIGSDLSEGTMTPFKRTIWVEARNPLADNSGPSEYEVISHVEWESKGVPRAVELRTILKKWQ